MSRRLAVLLAVAAAALVPAAPAAAASLADIEDEVMCISCNVPLNVAESPQADRQRALIRDLVEEGRSKEEIKDVLVTEYGTNVLALPQDEGFGRAAYLVPIAVGGGLVALWLLVLPRWRRRPPKDPGGSDGPALSAADTRRLDDDLARYDL